jgi:hypothetical protein
MTAKILTLLTMLAMLGGGGRKAGAATVSALQSANGTAFTWRNIIGANQSATIGWAFTVGAQDVELSALGIFDEAGDGLEDAHPAGIWTNGGTLLRQVTIPSGTAGTLIGGYRYQSVTPVTLAAGQTYVVGMYNGPVVDRCGSLCGDASLVFGSETFAPGISFAESRQTRAIIGSGPLAFPDVFAQIDQGFFGPNFLLAVPDDPVSAPEPASFGMVSVAIVAAAWRRRGRNR